jgi:hypothetical protein
VSGKERLHRAAIELIDVDVLACHPPTQMPQRRQRARQLSGE